MMNFFDRVFLGIVILMVILVVVSFVTSPIATLYMWAMGVFKTIIVVGASFVIGYVTEKVYSFSKSVSVK